MSFSFRLARETNDQLSEASADVVAALDAEEKAWLLRAAARFQQVTAAWKPSGTLCPPFFCFGRGCRVPFVK